MKKLILKASIACFVSAFVVFSSNQAHFAQASLPATGSTNTGTTVSVPAVSSTNTGTTSSAPVTAQTNTGATATVPATGQTNTGTTNNAASVPATSQTNTGATASVPATGQTNTGTTYYIPATGQTNTGATNNTATVPATGQTNTGSNSASTATVPATGQTNTGSNTSSTATVPATGQTNTGSNTASTATVPATGQTNTGSNTSSTATVPATGQTNTGSNTASTATVPATGQTNTGANTTSDTTVTPVAPVVQSNGGGGGSVISYSSSPCSSVTYGEWNGPSNGYQYRDVIGQNPTGCALSIAQQEARSRKYPTTVEPQILGVKYYPDGSLLRGPDLKIYIIIDGRKQVVRNWGELYKKYGGQKINNVSYEVLAQYPEILGVKTYADGSLLRGPDRRIYLIVYSRKQRIRNLKELANYKGRTIYNVSYEVLAQYPEVLGVKVFATGNLLRGLDKKIYLITNGKRKQIRNLQELINYRGREIIDVDNEILENYPLI